MEDMVPDFATYNGFQKEEFLRDIGVAEYDEMNLFNLLCMYTRKSGKPDIKINEFLTYVRLWAKEKDKPELMGGEATRKLFILLEKLQQKYLIVIEKDSDTPVSFCLKSAGRLSTLNRNTIETIREEYKEFDYNIQKPFPNRAQFDIPDRLLNELNCREFTKENIQRHSQSDKVIVITFSEFIDIIGMPENIDMLLGIAYRKIHFYLGSNRDLYDYVYLELRRTLPSKKTLTHTRLFEHLERKVEAESMFWIHLALAIFKAREKASQIQKMDVGNISIYQSAYLLYSYWLREYEIEKKIKSMESDEKHIVDTIRKELKIFNFEELYQMRDKKGQLLKNKYDDYNDFISSLLKRYTTRDEADSYLPPIVKIQNYFIHRDNILTLFFDFVSKASSYCARYFYDKWLRDLEQKTHVDKTMLSDCYFIQEIERQIQKEFPILNLLLSNARTVHACVAERIESGKQLLRRHAFLLVSNDKPHFKELNTILLLDRERISESIISHFSFFRRFFLKLRLKMDGYQGTMQSLPQENIKSSRIIAGRITAKKRNNQDVKKRDRRRDKWRKKPRVRRPRKVESESRIHDGQKRMEDAVTEFREVLHKRSMGAGR